MDCSCLRYECSSWFAPGDFDDNVYTATMTVKSLEFSASTVESGATSVLGGIHLLPGSIGDATTSLFVSLEYNLNTDESVVAAEYNLNANLSDRVWTYAGLEVAYETASEDVFVTPSAGLGYTLGEKISVFGEVDYTFNASEDFAEVDGTVELGFDFGVTEALSIRPSVVMGFESQETNASLELVASF